MIPVRGMRCFLTGLALAAAAVPGAGAATLGPGSRAAEQIAALSQWKAARSATDRKIDSRLLFALDRESGRFGARAPALASIEAWSPAEGSRAAFDLDLHSGEAVAEVTRAVRRAGGSVRSASVRFRSLRAELALEAVRALAAEPGVRRIVPAREAMTNALVAEGDRTHRADEARNLFALSGAGTKVCALSDGVASLEWSQELGELPAVDVLPGQAGAGDEGTAMLEIVHDLAPGAALGFATATNGLASFAENILDLAAAGCTVIVDDVIYVVESPFQDGPIAAAVNEVAAAGVLYVSSAGNLGNLTDGTSGTWEGDFDANGTLPTVPGLELHDFGDGGVSNLVLDAAPAVVLHWADPFGSSANDYDLYVLSEDLSEVVRFSNDTQDGAGGDDDPVEVVSFFGSGAYAGEHVVVARAAGVDRLLNVVGFRGELERSTAGALRGHTAAMGAISAAAAPAAEGYTKGQPTGPFPLAYDAGQLSETFTADGPRRIFFDAAGALLAGAPPGNFSSTGGVVRAKPDLTAADGVVTSVSGFERFYGTSASAPHIAAIAALGFEAFPGIAAADLRARLEATALDIEAAGRDRDTGHGIVRTVEMFEAFDLPLRANLALGQIVPVEIAGNGDAVIDPGETWRLEIELENVGGAAASTISATLGSSDPAVSIVSGAATWPDLGAATSASPSLAPVVRFAGAAACGAILPFTLSASYGGGPSPEQLSFTLSVGGEAGAPMLFSWNGPPVPIPDSPRRGTPGPAAFARLEIAGLEGRIRDLDLILDGEVCSTEIGSTTVGIDHPFVSNLLLELISPAGTAVAVIRFADGFGNNFCQTVLDDESTGVPIQSVETPDNPFSGSYTPARSLSSFDGEEGNGVWTLRATDWNQHDVGHLRAFSLRISPAACARAPSAIEIPALASGGRWAMVAALMLAALGSVVVRRRAR